MAGQRVHGSELAGAFASLRANDLVWNYVVNNYLKGETPPAFDLLYWNGDSANLPGPMYAYYLRNMYLDNRLREPGALTMAGEPIDLARDHRADLRATRPATTTSCRGAAAYRTTSLLGGDVDVRAGRLGPHRRRDQSAGEEAAQLLDQRARHRRRRRLARRARETVPGSWWPHWAQWLRRPRRRACTPAPRQPAAQRYPPLEPAPGATSASRPD